MFTYESMEARVSDQSSGVLPVHLVALPATNRRHAKSFQTIRSGVLLEHLAAH